MKTSRNEIKADFIIHCEEWNIQMSDGDSGKRAGIGEDA